VTLRWGAWATKAPACGQPRTSARRITKEARSAARGGASALAFLHREARHDGRLTEASRVDGEHKDMKRPGATSRRGRLLARFGWHVAKPGVRRSAWPQPCLHTRGLALPARCIRLVTRGVARGGAAAHLLVPAQESTARRLVPFTFLARRRRCPRARTAQELPPSRYDSSAARWPAPRQDLEGDASRRRRSITGKRPRGRKEQGGRAVLTVGRRCSCGQLSEEVCAGRVDVHDGGHPQLRLLAPVWLAFPPRRGATVAHPLPLPFRRTQWRRGGENSNGVGGLATGSRLPGGFEARRRAARGDLPPMPPGRPPGLGRWHPRPPHKPRLGGARRGGKRVTAPSLAGSDPSARAPALSVQAAWLVRLSRRARPARSGSADSAVGKSGDGRRWVRLTGRPHTLARKS
jgi:hypothetical protein